MRIVHVVLDFVRRYRYAIGGISTAMFVVSALLVPVFIQILPEDYFVKEKMKSRISWVPFPLHVLYLVFKNVVGVLLIILGLAMLVLPGQGLLTIMVGVILADIPGERQVFLFILRKTPVLKMMNWLREKKGIPPFRLPEP